MSTFTREDLLAMRPMEALALLDHPERFEEFSESALDGLVMMASSGFAILRTPGLDKIMPLYEVYARRVPDAARQALASGAREAAAAGEISPMLLFPFFLLEPQAHIAAMAALDVAVLSPLEGGDPLTGPKHLLEIFRSGAAKNRAAIFGGLLLLGDRRVTRLLWDARNELTPDEMETVGRCQSGGVWAATVEFWLDWLEELPGDAEDPRFGWAAWILSQIPRVMSEPEVCDIERIFPVTLDLSEPARILGRWPVAEYAKGVVRRLRAIERREPEPKVMPRVIEAWATSPR